MNLVQIANLHLTCKYFYELISKKWFNLREYVCILIDTNGKCYPGNSNGYKYSYVYRLNNDIIEFLIDNIFIHYDLPLSSCSLFNPLPLLSTVNNYASFKILIKRIIDNKLIEDDKFPKNSENITDAVISYANEKKIQDLYNDIMVRFPCRNGMTNTLTHKIRKTMGVHIIDWGRQAHIIKEVANRVRKIYPDFVLYLPNGKLFYSYDAIESY
jgi:hypothetical protein